ETNSGLPDCPIKINGLPSPPAALYHGPAFPPQPSQCTPLTEPILSTIQQRETLENRLLDCSITNVKMIRRQQLVLEVSTVPTPASTPEPDSTEPLSPVRTPDLSQHLSSALSSKENNQGSASSGPERFPVGTPATTPIPSPTRVATPSPPPANQSPNSASLQNHPWGGTELPLEEEEPHSERQEQPSASVSVVMSVAQEDHEEESVIHSSPPLPSKPKTSPPPLPPVSQEPPPAAPLESFSSSPSSEVSSSCTSVTVTETETPARHISEGELLLTHGQMAAVRVLTEEGVLLPNLMTSLNSSLHGVQDMDYDPPSEGQVIGAPRLPAHHDPVLSLLARMEHGLVNQLKAARGIM
ncbi:hypothetical protein cypCar_00025274, partial [Cyprinus carpio]